MSCNWGQIISFWGDIINLWGHIISFWGHIISFWGRYPYWGQGSIGGKIIILWGDFELGARLLTYGGILLTFGGVIINYILYLVHAESVVYPKGLLFLLDLEELWGGHDFVKLIHCHLRSLKHVKLAGNDHCPGEYHCSN